jgi:transcriptional regulator EpsA
MKSAAATEPTQETAHYEAEAVVRLIEAAVQVRRRYQFFVWCQSYLQVLVPHELLVCGAYQRTRREMVYEVFNSVVVPAPLLETMSDGSSALMRQVVGAWIESHGQAIVMAVGHIGGAAAAIESASLTQAGVRDLLVHGVSRPNRPAELESLFIFSSMKRRWADSHKHSLGLVLPQLHSAYLKAQATEREMAGLTAAAPPLRSTTGRGVLVTDRERQILSWVREGMNNHQIAEQLDISALTVKNHIHKVLRKLGAANRAQAVAKAMTMNMLGGSAIGRGDDAPDRAT